MLCKKPKIRHAPRPVCAGRQDTRSPLSAPRVVERDPDDDHVIACALAAHADGIVSGDLGLNELGQHQVIPILTVSQARARLA